MKLKQLGLLIWKNFMLQKRRPIGTIVQLGLPFFMSLIYVLLRVYLIDATKYDAVTWPEYNISTPPPTLTKSFSIGYTSANGTHPSNDMINNITYYLNENAHPGQNITLKYFKSEDVMVNAIQDSSSHKSSNCIGGIYFSTLPGKANGKIDYTLRFSIKESNKGLAKNGHEWLTKYVFPKFQLPQPRNKKSVQGDNPSYYNAGFLFTQLAVDRAIMTQFGTETAVDVYMQKFPFPSYTKDTFIFIIQNFMPNFFVIAFIYTALVIVRSIVYEKEKRLKETLKMIGVDNWLHWVAWFLQSFIICLIVITIMTLMFTIRFNNHGKVIEQTSPAVLFVFLLLYIISGIMFCFFLSVFFSKASTAAAGGGIIWYVSFIPFFFISQSYEEMSLGLKTLCCLIPNLGMSLGSIVIGKFEGTGIGVHWDNLYHSASVDDDLSLGTVFLMMIVSSIMYAVLTWYIENVFPGEFGTPQPWYFPVTKSYWCGSFEKVSVSHETLPLLSNQDRPSEKFEKDPEGLEVGIDIKELRKVYDGETGKKIAVNDISMKMYEGQITVLLGHNGAGKTSLMSVLTGFYSPSGGTAVINGYDIRTSMDGVRSSLGLCPQHDVLYETLTVREHLWFFGKLKGLTKDETDGEIEKMMESIKLADKSNAQTRFLSGGMKRKLSLGLALIGKAKVLMLDEPTSGMDPSARRFTWDLLQKYRSGRTILLTTHFMDEADVLGDRIAIMADGKVRCCGTSLFLKNHYGVGYHIVMVKKPECNVKKITELVKQFVPHSKLESNAGAELSYILPRESSQNFSTLFSQLEEKHQELGIASYGASMTTMEEVFMKVGTECDETLHDQLRATYGGNADAINTSMNSTKTDRTETPNGYSNHLNTMAKTPTYFLNTGMTLRVQCWYAMLKKRYLYSRRYKMAIISQLLMPLIFTLLALIAAETIPKPEDSPPRVLTTAMFDKNDAPYSTGKDAASAIKALARMYKYSTSSKTSSKYINNITAYENGNMTMYLLDRAKGKNLGYFNKHCLVAATFEDRNNNVTAKAWFNDQAYHAVAVSLNAVNNAILKNISKNASEEITVTNYPLPRTLKQQSDDLDNNAIGLNVAFNLLFGMAFLASSFVVYVVQERANGAKHVQFVSGVDPLSYWTASWTWDFVNLTFPCLCIIILFAAFDVPAYTGDYRLGIVLLVLLLYGFAIIPFMYLFSFLFKMASKAYIRLTLLNIFTGLVALLTVYIIDIAGYPDTANVLNWILFLLPNFSLGQTFSNIFTNYNRIRIYDEYLTECRKMYRNISCEELVKREGVSIDFQRDYLAWDTPGIGRFILVLPLEGIFFMCLVLFIDYNIARKLLRSNQAPLDPFGSIHQEESEDSDVMTERRRVLDGEAADDVLVIKDLKKVFVVPGRPKLAAVNGLCLGVPLGECFGLLGVNGAGKTTTFKMLTGDEIPTFGTASVDSFDIQADLNLVRQRTGYCPQFDALIDLMTGREMLQMYAALRGVPYENIDALVEDLMQSVLLTEHADKLTKTYSGGNKRKLSAAIALVGNPLVVFLDEPTTGMDPVARRLLWNTLCRVRAEGRCLVITSHSMEECEALCTRLAIMVNGKFRCLGSPQHLKNKFVQGFTLLVNVSEDNNGYDTVSLKEFIANTFPGSVLRDEHNGLLNYHLAGTDSAWSALFATLEDANSRGIIGNYAVTQTTLEQIFLNFARAQRGYED